MARFRSPLLWPAFLLVPLVFIFNYRFGGVQFDPFWLLLNNVVLLCYIVNRAAWGVWTWVKGRPFGLPGGMYLAKSAVFPISATEMTDRLCRRGFFFSEEGRFAEQRRPGHAGMILSHLVLAVVIGFGSYDYFTEFSGTLTCLIGQPVRLNSKKQYSALQEGYFHKAADVNLGLQLKRQLMPSKQQPLGAADIALLSPEGAVVKEGSISPGTPLRRGPYEFKMLGHSAHIWVIITTDRMHDLFGGSVELDQMPGTEGFIFFGEFWDELTRIRGKVRFDPYRMKVLIDTERDGKSLGTVELGMGSANTVLRDGYRYKFESYGITTNIAVVKMRHSIIRFAGLALAAGGLLLWLAFRPRRVLLIPDGAGCMVKSNDISYIQRMVS